MTEKQKAAATLRYTDPVERAHASKIAKRRMRDPKELARARRRMARARIERAKGLCTALGLSDSPEYRIWSAAIERCKESSRQRSDYFDRGIYFCAEWRGRGGFLRFYQHVGPRPSPKHTLDRKNNDGNYEPGNVRWVLREVQMSNSRRAHLVTINGESKTIAEWARYSGVHPSVLAGRVRCGWPVERLFAPTRSKRS